MKCSCCHEEDDSVLETPASGISFLCESCSDSLGAGGHDGAMDYGGSVNILESLEFSLWHGVGTKVRAEGVRQAIISLGELVIASTAAAERLESINATGVIARDNKRIANALREAISKSGG